MYVANAFQMKKYDQRLLDEGYGIETLVDKASDCVVPYCQSYQKLAIVCSAGNNGADGISLASKLKQAGKEIKLYLVGDFSKASKANLFYLERAKVEKIDTLFVEGNTVKRMQEELPRYECIVDAIFGFGLHSNPRGVIGDVIQVINKAEVNVLAIDIPSGLQPDTGTAFPNTIYASETITLTAYKLGFLNPESKKYTGKVFLETLKIKDFREAQGIAQTITETWVVNRLKERDYYAHKGVYGKVMHVTGSFGYRGAAMLSAKASVYTGSGVVCVQSENVVLQQVSSFVPECTLMERPLQLDASSYQGYDAVLLGCGIGLHTHSRQYVLETLKQGTQPLVIDADALTIVAEHQELLKNYPAPIILTPHIGEFKRFVPYLKEVEMVDVAKEFAATNKVIVVLKGPNTIITDGVSVYRNTTGNKAMAVAGMGDVLAGIITSFLGQGYSAKNAAMLGTYLHGLCGDAESYHTYTALPSKVIAQIPKQMYALIDKK